MVQVCLMHQVTDCPCQTIRQHTQVLGRRQCNAQPVLLRKSLCCKCSKSNGVLSRFFWVAIAHHSCHCLSSCLRTAYESACPVEYGTAAQHDWRHTCQGCMVPSPCKPLKEDTLLSNARYVECAFASERANFCHAYLSDSQFVAGSKSCEHQGSGKPGQG